MAQARDRLPANAIERSQSLVLRSLPEARARLPGHLDAETAEVILQARNARASMYADMEDMNDRTRRLGEEMDAMGVVMHIVDDDDADSMVNHMVDTAATVVVAELAEAAAAVTAAATVACCEVCKETGADCTTTGAPGTIRLAAVR